jgi:uncharacterized surface protein with fasciclin (FAS1) repeats
MTKMNRIQPYFYLAILSLFLFGCQEYEREDKYKRPDWLAGKVYTQVKDQPQLSTFARCIELTGYDTILDVSGSYTIFAPNNEAFSDYFQNHPVYSSVEDIPLKQLNRMVKYHIVQNPWSKQQLRSLDVLGWIDTLDLTNNLPRGYKRETLLRENNWKFGVASDEHGNTIIVDTLESDLHRKVYTDSRKYVPIFYKEYFDIYKLSSRDYEFYFDRPMNSSDDMFYAGGKLLGEEIFAENGFVFEIDRVIEPLPNAYQILSSTDGENSYQSFLDLIFLYPEFRYNQEKTQEQPGAEEGLVVDSLFDLDFPELTWDIHKEKTEPPTGTVGLPSNTSIRYHHGLLAPTDIAFADFIHEYIETGEGIPWGSLDNTPEHIKRIIANTYLSTDPVYPTDFESGFYNGELDIVRLGAADIIEKRYGSNCTFIGLNKAIVPRAFQGVTGPVYLSRGYSFTMYAIERSGLLSALKRENEDYMFFIESDKNCREDSSLLYNEYTEDFYVFVTTGADPRRVSLGSSDLQDLLLNHIGTHNPRGLARKEFIKNRAGNYLILNNETGEIRGTAPSTYGYQGSEEEIDYPTQISSETDNGYTYDIKNWFSFSAIPLLSVVSQQHPVFHSLLQKAGLVDNVYDRYAFISNNEIYTIFAPTDSVLNLIRADTLPIPELKQFCLMHVIQGDIIFTDGNKSPGYYETLRVDESSTEFLTFYNSLYIEPGIDIIRMPDNSGGDYVIIEESDNTNSISSITLSSGGAFQKVISNAVVHSTNRAFDFELMDTK